jgi:ubiquinone biosynthesis UbiH/UbiF/VisC/COQ6 family hydroxylase
MQIWESQSPAMLVFSQHDLDGNDEAYLGACVEDSALTSSLYKALEGSESVSLHTQTSLSSFQVQGNKVELTVEKNEKGDKSESSSPFQISTSLLIAADGGHSPIRKTLGIPWRGLEYGRTAITFTVELSKAAFAARAYQRFLPNGPIALLPTYSSNHAVVVWSTTPEEALALKELDSAALVERLNDKLQEGPQRLEPLFESKTGGTSPLDSLAYGVDRVLDTIHYGLGMRHWSDDPEIFLAPPLVSNVVSPKFTFPLSCKVASSVISKDNRIALIGDAAHIVHPMAGQGLNIGLEDVEALMRVAIQKSHDAGMDAAQFLPDYQTERQVAIPAKVGGIHLLHSLFGMQSAPMKHGKSIGMSLVNQVGPLRRQLAKIATGLE